jgi:hypothetical protein
MLKAQKWREKIAPTMEVIMRAGRRTRRYNEVKRGHPQLAQGNLRDGYQLVARTTFRPGKIEDAATEE